MVPKLVLSFSDTYKRGPSELDQAVSFKIQENIHNLYTRLKDHNPLPMLETLRTNTETQQPETLKFVGFEDGSVQLSHHRPPAFQKDLSNLYMSAKRNGSDIVMFVSDWKVSTQLCGLLSGRNLSRSLSSKKPTWRPYEATCLNQVI